MTLDWLYQLGNWNPQFARELKGRLTPRIFGTTVLASLVIQGVALFYFLGTLPTKFDKTHNLCTGKVVESYSYPQCVTNALGEPLVNWQMWWSWLYQLLSWTLPFVLLIAGVYLLINDLGKEEKRGTLNFIRLSPQTSESILLGKILGVPVVPFVALGLAVPLHLWAGISSHTPLGYILSVYLLSFGVCACFYIGSLLYAFMGGFQGWVGAIAILFGYNGVFSLFLLAARSSDLTTDEVRHFGLGKWFGFPMGTHLWSALPFLLMTLGIAATWLGIAANRRFRNPHASLFCKSQSYLATTSFGLWVIGFTVRDRGVYDPLMMDLTFVGIVGMIWLLLLIAALTPQRQTVLDWARYHHQQANAAPRSTAQTTKVIPDLLWGEKSPALLALAVNAGILGVMYSLRILLAPMLSGQEQKATLAGLLLGLLYLLICGAIAQLMLMQKSKHRTAWAAGTIMTVSFVPTVVLGILAVSPLTAPLVWMLSPAAMFTAYFAPLTAVLGGFLAHLTVLGVLTARLTHQINKAGESEMKALLAAAQR